MCARKVWTPTLNLTCQALYQLSRDTNFMAVCISPVNPHFLRSHADEWHLENTTNMCSGHKYNIEISLPWWNSHKDTHRITRLYMEIESTKFLLENYGPWCSSLCGLVWFVSLWNGDIHTSLIEGSRYRINNKDLFSGKENHLTRSVYATLDEQGSFFFSAFLRISVCEDNLQTTGEKRI